MPEERCTYGHVGCIVHPVTVRVPHDHEQHAVVGTMAVKNQHWLVTYCAVDGTVLAQALAESRWREVDTVKVRGGLL